jgi:thiol-disulfide isomerase/thioredoxin
MDKNRFGHDDVWVENRLGLLDPDVGWEPNVLAGLTRLKKEMHRKKAQVRKRWMWLAVTVGLACLPVLVFPLPRVLAHRCLECSVAVLQSLAQINPPPENLKPEGERKVAPNFDLEDAEGESVQLSALKGRVVAVNFWATWCHGCQLEIPAFIELEKKYGNRGLAIVGISMDDDAWKSVRPWIKEKGVNYTIVIGNNDLSQKYGLVGMPLSVLVDREGRIANSHAGVVNRAAFEQQIQALLREHAKGSVN